MGPWLCSHGNLLLTHSIALCSIRLQWGRGCVATEIPWANRWRIYGAAASMGPWLCSHGNLLTARPQQPG